MIHNTVDYSLILNDVIRELHACPVDLLSIGDGDGESAYLEHSRQSYQRTLKDIVQLVDSLHLKPHEVRILEIGGFLGVVSSTLARIGFDVTVLDIPEFMSNMRLSKRYLHDGVATIAANLRDYLIPVQSGTLTLAIMCETLEHLNFNPLPVMAEVNRILSADGYLYLSLPNQASLVNRAKLLAGRSIHNPVTDFAEQLTKKSNMVVGIHWREYTAAELREMLDLSGFSIVSHEFFTTHHASLPARLAYALFPKLRSN